MHAEADLHPQEHQRRCLIRQLLAWRAINGLDWMREYVKDWRRWPDLQHDFEQQWRAGNRGEPGDWRDP